MVEKIPMTPDYRRIYMDMIRQNFPSESFQLIPKLNEMKEFSNLDIIEFNRILFGHTEEISNGKFRIYKKVDIETILKIQKKFNYNNSEVAKKFKVSRNSIAKWKKIYNF